MLHNTYIYIVICVTVIKLHIYKLKHVDCVQKTWTYCHIFNISTCSCKYLYVCFVLYITYILKMFNSINMWCAQLHIVNISTLIKQSTYLVNASNWTVNSRASIGPSQLCSIIMSIIGCDEHNDRSNKFDRRDTLI